MSERLAIVFAVDRIGSGYLGPYGNTWIDTPGFNRFACRSQLWENAVADSPDLRSIYRSYWTGLPAFCPQPPDSASRPSTIAQLAKHQVETTLITDCNELQDFSLAENFRHRQFLPGENSTPGTLPPPAVRIEETQLAKVTAAAIDFLANSGNGLLWVHAATINQAWDAPLELRNRFAEEDDPTPMSKTTVPSFDCGSAPDPDEILAVTHAYAGHLVLADQCLAAFLTALEQHPGFDDCLMIFTSPRGFPLGEHGYVGAAGDGLSGEVLHVPLMVRGPHDEFATLRPLGLTQPADISSTLLRFFDCDDPSGWGYDLLAPWDEFPRQIAYGYDSGNWSLRTLAWFLRDGQVTQLYGKPDDRWEVNEVADRCAAEVEQFREIMQQAKQAAQANSPQDLPLLADELT